MPSSVTVVGLVVFWYAVTLIFNYTAFNLVVLKDDPALALKPEDITLIEMFACTICGALTLYSKSLQFIPPAPVRTRMFALSLTNAAACRLFMMAMDFVKLSLVQTIRACQPLFTVVIGA
jgi:drug/metabolite transporter (DMT)-like permease